jgi:hypothetical protein
MNREVINQILNEVEALNAAFAGGKIPADQFVKTQQNLDMRLRIYGLALASVSVVPPF